MTSTSTVRWHRSGCSKPGVIVEDGVPQCHSCGATSSALVAQLVAQKKIKGGDIHLPAEAPLGEANLWWPPCVPYRKPQEVITSNSMPTDDKEAPAEPSNKDFEPSSVSHIYPRSLDSDHFRLIYLGESDDVSSPIHIHLEVYPLDDHPEYETVSYVWGGECGDSTLCKPIYVGHFWDIILITSNCSALLHYLRRPRVRRIIWVDAICINQADNAEKPAQISRMGDIYTNCERVVAFFGEDLISQPTARTFRTRIDLQTPVSTDDANSDEQDEASSDEQDDASSYEQEKAAKFLVTCADTAHINLDQLFERRYLTRIWIVQELVLSKRALFPLGDSDIICTREEAMRLVLRTHQAQLARSDVTGQSLSHLLKATSHCHASDPRDRIYGLLGLFQPQEIPEILVANYSLSWRDCWVGTAAYMLLIEGKLILLAHAVSYNGPTNFPSWVPDTESARYWLIDLLSTDYGRRLQVSRDGTSLIHAPMLPALGNWATEFVMYSLESEVSVECENFRAYPLYMGVWRKRKIHWSVHSRALYTTSLKSASVGPSDGALQLQALRVFDSPCRLTTETDASGLTSIWVRGPSTAAQFRMMGLKQPEALDGKYWFYLIDCSALESYTVHNQDASSSNIVLLALATVLPEKGSHVVTLHDCCIVLDVRIYSMELLEANLRHIHNMTNARHSLYWVLEALRYAHLRSSVWQSTSDWIFACMFPSFKAITQDIWPLLISLSEQERLLPVPPALADSISATAESICPNYNPVIQDNCFHLTIKNYEMLRTWDSEVVHLRLDPDEELQVSYSYLPVHGQAKWRRLFFSEEGDDGKVWREFWSGHKLPVTVRFPLVSLLSYIKRSTLYRAMCCARGFSNLLDEDLETLLARRRVPEDRCIFLGGWGQSLIEELGLVWKLERITIV